MFESNVACKDVPSDEKYTLTIFGLVMLTLLDLLMTVKYLLLAYSIEYSLADAPDTVAV